LDSRLEGCRTRIIDDYFSKLWKIKTGRFKTKLIFSLILRFYLRLKGYSIWKYSEDTFNMKFRKNLKMPLEVLGSLQYSTTESSGTCQTLNHGTEYMP
jgi:hypothetical protein